MARQSEARDCSGIAGAGIIGVAGGDPSVPISRSGPPGPIRRGFDTWHRTSKVAPDMAVIRIEPDIFRHSPEPALERTPCLHIDHVADGDRRVIVVAKK
jgi:hypothetical protein